MAETVGSIAFELQLDRSKFDRDTKSLSSKSFKPLPISAKFDIAELNQQLKTLKVAPVLIPVRLDVAGINKDLQDIAKTKKIAVPIGLTIDSKQVTQLRASLTKGLAVPVKVEVKGGSKSQSGSSSDTSKPKTQKVNVQYQGVRSRYADAEQRVKVKYDDKGKKLEDRQQKVKLDPDDLEKTISKSVERGTKKAQSKGLFGGLAAIPGKIISNSISGFQQGIGFSSAQEFTKGLQRTLKKEAGLELDKLGDQAAKALTRLGEFTGKRIQTVVARQLGVEELITTLKPRLAKAQSELKPFFENLIDDKAVSRKVNALELAIGKLIDDLARLKSLDQQIANVKGVGGAVADIGGEFKQAPARAIKKRRQDQLGESARRAQALSELIDAPELEPGQGATIVSGGFARAKGKSSDVVAAQTQALLGKSSKVIGVRNEATDIEIPKIITKALGEKDYLAGVPIAGVGKFAEQNIAKGRNDDAIKAAAQALAIKRKNPEANVNFLGYSAGGYVAQEAVEILKELGVESTGIGLGTPRFGATATTKPEEFRGVLGSLDTLNAIQDKFQTPGDLVKVPGAGRDHQFESYLANPEVQQLIQSQLKLPDLAGAQTSLGEFQRVKVDASAKLLQESLTKVRGLSGEDQTAEATKLASSIPYFRSQINRIIASSSREISDQLLEYLKELQTIENELQDLSKPKAAPIADLKTVSQQVEAQQAPQPPPLVQAEIPAVVQSAAQALPKAGSVNSPEFKQAYLKLVKETSALSGTNFSSAIVPKIDTKANLPEKAGAAYSSKLNAIKISPDRVEQIQQALGQEVQAFVDKDLTDVAKQLSLLAHEVFHGTQYGFSNKTREELRQSGGIQAPIPQVSDAERQTFERVRGNTIDRFAEGSLAGAKGQTSFQALPAVEQKAAEAFIRELEVGAYSFEAKFLTEFFKQAEEAQGIAGKTISDVFNQAISNVSSEIQKQSGVKAPEPKTPSGGQAQTTLEGYNADIVKEIARITGRGTKGKKAEIIQDILDNVGIEDIANAIAAVKPLIEYGPKGGQQLKKVSQTDVEKQLLSKTAESEKRVQDSLQLFNKAQGDRRNQLAAVILNEIEFTANTLEKLGKGQIAPETRLEAGRRKGRLENIRQVVGGEFNTQSAPTATAPTQAVASAEQSLAIDQIPIKFAIDASGLEQLSAIEAQLKEGFTVGVKFATPDITKLREALKEIQAQLTTGLKANVTFNTPATAKLQADLNKLQSKLDGGLSVGVAIKTPSTQKLQADLNTLREKLAGALVVGVRLGNLNTAKLQADVNTLVSKASKGITIPVRLGSINTEAVKTQIQAVATQATKGITVPVTLGNITTEATKAELKQVAESASVGITVPVKLGEIDPEGSIAQIKAIEESIAQPIKIPVVLGNISVEETKTQLAAIKEQAATGVTVPVKLGAISGEKLEAELATLRAELGKGLAIATTLQQPNTAQLQKDLNTLQEKLKAGLKIPVVPELAGLVEAVSSAIVAGFEQGYQKAGSLAPTQPVAPTVDISKEQQEVDSLLGQLTQAAPPITVDVDTSKAQEEVDNLLGAFQNSEELFSLDTLEASISEIGNQLKISADDVAQLESAFSSLSAVAKGGLPTGGGATGSAGSDEILRLVGQTFQTEQLPSREEITSAAIPLVKDFLRNPLAAIRDGFKREKLARKGVEAATGQKLPSNAELLQKGFAETLKGVAAQLKKAASSDDTIVNTAGFLGSVVGGSAGGVVGQLAGDLGGALVARKALNDIKAVTAALQKVKANPEKQGLLKQLEAIRSNAIAELKSIEAERQKRVDAVGDVSGFAIGNASATVLSAVPGLGKIPFKGAAVALATVPKFQAADQKLQAGEDVGKVIQELVKELLTIPKEYIDSGNKREQQVRDLASEYIRQFKQGGLSSLSGATGGDEELFSLDGIDEASDQVQGLVEQVQQALEELQKLAPEAIGVVKEQASTVAQTASTAVRSVVGGEEENKEEVPEIKPPSNLQQLAGIFSLGQKAVSGFNNGINQLAKALDSVIPGAGGLVTSLKGAVGAFAGFAIVSQIIPALQQFASESVTAAIKATNLKTALDFAAGSSAGGSASLKFVRDEVDRLRIPLEAAQTGFVKLSAATRGTTNAGQTTKDLFSGISSAATVLGLSSDEAGGSLLALSQIASKGSVQAEELRGQLGERIPGAFGIAARAMGVTEGALSKMLELGQVTSTEFLPKFARQMQIEFGGAAVEASKNAQSSIFNLQNAFLKLQETVGKALLPFIQGGADTLAEGMNAAAGAAARAGETIGKLTQILGGVLGVVGKITGAISGIPVVSKAAETGFNVIGAILASVAAGGALSLLGTLSKIPIISKAIAAALSFITGGFVKMLPAIGAMLAKFIVIQLAIETVSSLFKAFVPNELTSSFQSATNQIVNNLDRVGKAARAAKGDIEKLPPGQKGIESQGVDVGSALTFGAVSFKTDDFVKAARFGNTNWKTIAEKQFEDSQVAGGDFNQQVNGLAQNVMAGRLSDGKGGFIGINDQLNKVAGIDKQITALQNQKNILSSSATPDKKALADLDQQIQSLQNEQKLQSAPLTEARGAIESSKNSAKAQIEAINASSMSDDAKAELRKPFEDSLAAIDQMEARIAKFEKGVKTSSSAGRELQDTFLQIAASLDEAVRKAQQLANTKQARALEGQFKTFTTDQLGGQKAAVKTAQAEQENAQSQFDSQQQALDKQKTAIQSDAVQAVLAGIPNGTSGKAITADSSIEEIDAAIKTVGEKNPQQKQVLEQLKQYREGLGKLTESDRQLQQSKLASKQAEQALATAQLDLANAQRQAKSRLSSNTRVEANVRGQLKEFGNKADPKGSLARSADLEIQSAQNNAKDVADQTANAKAALDELNAAKAKGQISAEEYAKRERELTSELSDLKVKAAQAELAVKEAVQKKALALIEREAQERENATRRAENNIQAGLARERGSLAISRGRLARQKAGNQISDTDAAVASADLGIKEADANIRGAQASANSAAERLSNTRNELEALNKAYQEGRLQADEYYRRREDLQNRISDGSRAAAEATAGVQEAQARREEALAAKVEATNRRIIEGLELANRRAEAAINLSLTNNTTAARSTLLTGVTGESDQSYQRAQQQVDRGITANELEATRQKIEIKKREIEQNKQLVATRVRSAKEGTETEIRLQQELADLNGSIVDKELARQQQLRESAKALKESRERLQDSTLNYYQKLASLESEALDRAQKLLAAQNDLAKARNEAQTAGSQAQLGLTDKALDIRKQLRQDDLDPAKRQALTESLNKLGFTTADDEVDILNKKQEIEDEIARKKAEALALEQEFQRQSLEIEIRKNQLAAENLKIEAQKAKLQAQRDQLQAQSDLKAAQKRGDAEGIQLAKDQLSIANQSVDLADRQIAQAETNAAEQDSINNMQRQALQLRQGGQIQEAYANERIREVDQSLTGVDTALQAGVSPGKYNNRDSGALSILNNANTSIVLPITTQSNNPYRLANLLTASGSAPAIQDFNNADRLNQSVNQSVATVTPQTFTPIGANTALASNQDMKSEIATLNQNISQLANSPRSLTVSSPQPIQDAGKIYRDIANNRTTDAGL